MYPIACSTNFRLKAELRTLLKRVTRGEPGPTKSNPNIFWEGATP